MNLKEVSNSDQCSIFLNRQHEKKPIWEQDYLLLRKIVKVTAIGIACLGALYLLKTVCRAAYDDGYNWGIIQGKREGRDTTKQEALDQVTNCLDYQTKEDVMECVKRTIRLIY